MDTSIQGSKIIQNGIPIFLCLYFILAFYPKYLGNGKEIIPFTLFNLYTFIPYDYSNYDLQITDSCGESRLLFYENDNLTSIERKYYYAWLSELGEEYIRSNDVKLDSNHFILTNIEGEVNLVRLSGDYIETLRTGSNRLEILKRIK